MALVYWPRSPLIKPRAISVDVAPRSVAGPPSLYGQDQVVASSAGLWSITYHDILARGPKGVLLWRALAAQIQGRLNPIVLPVFERPARTPAGTLAATADIAAAFVPHSDGAAHGDGALYASSAGVDATVVGAVARGQVTWLLDVVGAQPLDAGMHFSVGHRLYRVAAVLETAGTVSNITAWPPAREAVVSGAVAEMARPVCKVRLAGDRELNEKIVHENRHGEIGGVSFIEDLS